MYEKGQGVPQDYAQAIKWYRLAAEQGEADAEFNLGIMYFYGRGLPQDHAEAIKWFQGAAEQGHASAEFNLGVIYAKGQGVPQDYVQAYMWFNRAARRASDTEGRDRAVRNRDSVAAHMTPAQIAEARGLAQKWTESHASRRK
jgi:TPR repeat protein